MCGPAVLAVAGVAPDPKFQVYVAPAPAVPVNVAVAFCPAQMLEGIVNAASVAAFIFITWVAVLTQFPEVAVSVMV